MLVPLYFQLNRPAICFAIMVANPNKDLWTCRCRALGTQAPNIDAFETNVCAYSCWDTDRSPSHLEQRGTVSGGSLLHE